MLAGILLAPVDAAGLRVVQLMVFQPAVTLMAAMLVLLTPLAARAAATRDLEAQRRLRRTALFGAAALGLIVLALVPVRGPIMEIFFPQYTAFEVLVLPIALQAVLIGFSAPFDALLRGFQRARTLFGLQVGRAVLLVGCAALGMVVGGVTGVAWALAAESVLALAISRSSRRACERPRTGRSPRAPWSGEVPMSGNTHEPIARRSLLAGLGALMLVAGCGRTEARASAPYPADVDGQDWSTQPDGPMPDTDALGRPYVIRRSGVTAGPWVAGGALVAETPAERGATYVNLDLDTRVERLGARFGFGPGNVDGSLCLAAWAGGVLPPGHGIRSATPVHLVITPDRWLHGVVDDGTLAVLASGGSTPCSHATAPR